MHGLNPMLKGSHGAMRVCLPPWFAATLLGATLADRLRINATWSMRGMLASQQAAAAAGGQLEFVGSFQSRFGWAALGPACRSPAWIALP